MDYALNDPVEMFRDHKLGLKLSGMAYIEARSIPEPNTGCWLWLGALGKFGYGVIKRDLFGEISAHRYSYAVANEPAGESYVLHRCDQPSCVNPDHLFVGTALDNSLDMVAKGRNVPFGKGEASVCAKLTEAEVVEIRGSYRKGVRGLGMPSLAKKFGVHEATIWCIINRYTWTHI